MSLSVWMVNHYALSPDQAGGTRHYTLAREMQGLGIDTTIFASSVDYATQQDLRLEANEVRKVIMEQGVRFVWLKTPVYRGNGLGRGLNMLTFLIRMLALPLHNLPKPDIIIGSSPHLFGALAGYIMSRRLRVPFILEVRDIWPKTLTELGRMSPNHPIIVLFGAIERFLYRRSAAVITLLQGAGEHIRQVAGQDVPLIWIPNGVDTTLFAKPKPLPKSRFRAIYAGAHGIANNLETLLRAAEILQREGYDIELELVGDGPEKSRLQEMAANKVLRNVTFRDPVPKAAMSNVLGDAHVCIMPLLNSPVFKHGVSPNKLFDYLAAERPVVFAVNTPYNAVQRVQAGLTIPPEDPRAMADALVALSQLSENERRAMAQRGRSYIEQHHDMHGLAYKLGNSLWALAQRRGNR